MGSIPKAKGIEKQRIPSFLLKEEDGSPKILFSFAAIEKNDYFSLDGTCANWSSDLFDTLQKVSKITLKEIYSGKYSGKTSPFRIHQHQDAKAPCKIPDNISLDDMWQIRISVSKGGIHGILTDNIFYVIWFDPQHNLYPSENHGGLKKIIPPSSCCKDRDEEISILKAQLEEARNDAMFWENYAQEKEKAAQNLD